jgi:hypothetical protein
MIPLRTPYLGLLASRVEAVTFRPLYVPTYLQTSNGKGVACTSLSTELYYNPVQGLRDRLGIWKPTGGELHVDPWVLVYSEICVIYRGTWPPVFI